MRFSYTFIIAITSYLLYFLLSFNFLDSTLSRRLLYYYPNGFIAETNSGNKSFLGYNLDRDRDKPKINFEIEADEISRDLDFLTNLKVSKDFIFHLVFFLIYIICAYWFLIQSGDIFLYLFFLNLSILISADFFVLGFKQGLFLFYFCLFQTGFNLIHFAYRLKGKDVAAKWIIPELALSFILAFIGHSEQDNPVSFDKLVSIAGIFIFITASTVLTVAIYDTIKYRSESIGKNRKIVMSLMVFGLVVSMLCFFQFNFLKSFYYSKYIIYLFIILLPISFLYGFYRYSLFPKQLYYTSSLTVFYLVLVLIALYALLIYSLRYLAPREVTYLNYFNILFIFLAIIYAGNIKIFLAEIIEFWTFKRNSQYSNALEYMTNLITSPVPIRIIVNKLFHKIAEVLSVQKTILLVPSDRFAALEFKDVDIKKIPVTSEIWKYFSKTKDVTVTSYLVHGSGSRDSAHKFLRDLNIQIAYPMHGLDNRSSVSSVFLIGEKLDNKNFNLGELRFIKECTRLADLLLQNYMLLISEVEKKKMERDLNTIQLMQNTIYKLNFDESDFIDLDLGYVSIPAVGISGDYLDFIRVDENHLYIFLGDVSGHGVGSGYLVSAIRALVRDQIQMGIDLKKLFSNINTFLLERYFGNEFMSLIGGIYNFETSNFEYINAGHLEPYLCRENVKLEMIKGLDRVIGVLPTVFTVDSVKLEKGDKLIFYTDGVTETFNPSDEIYGYHRLEKIINQNLHSDSDTIVKEIIADLDLFRKGQDKSDDISLICLYKN